MSSIPIILLAAGGSKRLGRPKQLLPIGEGTLLRHAAGTALSANLGPVIVVLGSAEPECRRALAGLAVEICVNPQWDDGMGGSIACGMQRVDPARDAAVIIQLCDQPAITPGVMHRLVRRLAGTAASIAACDYGDELGPPALFTAIHFSSLRALRGSVGARQLMRNDQGALSVPWAAGTLDIDTEGDVEELSRFA